MRRLPETNEAPGIAVARDVRHSSRTRGYSGERCATPSSGRAFAYGSGCWRCPAQRPRAATPGAMIHHWMGTILIPGATLERVLSTIQDYDRHREYYAPEVARS